MIRFVSFLFLISLWQQSVASVFHSEEHTIHRHITNGEYKLALKSNQKLVRKIDRKFPDSTHLVGNLLIQQTLIKSYMDEPFESFKNDFQKGLMLVETKKGKQSEAYYTALLNICDVYQSKGYFLQADSLFKVIKKNTLNDAFQKYISYREVPFLLAIGQVDMAYEQAIETKKLVLNNLSEFTSYHKKGKIIQTKVPHNEFITRKRVYANHLHLIAKILIEKGNYPKADSALNDAKLWIEKEMLSNDISIVDHYFLKGLILNQLGTINDAQISFETALNLVNHTHFHFQYLETSPEYGQLIEELAMTYWADGKTEQATNLVNDYSPSIKRAYKRNNFHRGFLELLTAEKYYLKGDFEKAGKVGEKFFEKGFKTTDNYALQHKSLEKLIPIYEKLEAYDWIEKLYTCLDSLKNIQYPINSPAYHEDELHKAIYYTRYTNKFKIAEPIFEASFTKVLKNTFHSLNPKYRYFMNSLADLHEIMGNYAKAKILLEEMAGHTLKNYHNFDYRLGLQWLRLANLSIEMGNYQEAKEQLTRIEHLYEQDVNKNAEGRSDVYVYFGKLLMLTGQYNEAEDMFKKALSLSNNNEYSQKDIAEFATLYIKKGDYSKVEKILLETIEIKEKLYGVNSRHLLTALNQLAELYLIKGEYTVADKYSDRAVKIAFDIYGDKSLKYANSLKLQAEIGSQIGDLDHALNDYERVLAIQEKLLGKEHIAVASTLTEKAITILKKDKEAENILVILNEAAKIVENQLGKENPLYAEALQNIATYHIFHKQFSEADKYLEQANFIWLKKAGLGKSNINSAHIMSLRAEISKQQGKYPEALSQLEDAGNQYKKLFHKEHPEYVKILSKMAQLHYIMGEEKKAIATLNKTTDIYLRFISTYFDGLSERQKQKFWYSIRYDFEFYNTIALKNGNPKLIAKAYNHTLHTKAILLNSSIALRKAIIESKDETLIAKFNEWSIQKEKLNSYIGRSIEELEAENISLENEAKTVSILEKQLVELSEDFKREKNDANYTWKDVRNKLKENEFAIEIIRYRHFDKNFSDSIVYAALIVSPTHKKSPEVVVLESGNALEKRYISYYQNTIKYQIEDTLSYDIFWKNISAVVGKTSTVYLSVDGIYSQINIESLLTPEGEYVLDQNNIVLVNNTKDIFKKQIDNKKNLNIVFAGNPTFYDVNIADPKTGGLVTRSLDQSVAQLPGAEEEVNKSHNLFVDKGWNSTKVIHEKATEAFIRDKMNNPYIVHFATHGFFLADVEDVESADFGFVSRQEMNNPLLRCGLMLQHAGDIFEKHPFYKYNQEDGILTADEVRNLSLNGTKVVVLSACETGLGEILIGEGVQGLQKAFSEAGAETIIMSLFKVSDEATSLLMSTFYKKFLETNDIRTSFIDAKKEVRKQFPEPIYWGAFVLIGM